MSNFITKEEFLVYQKIKEDHNKNIQFYIKMSELTGLSKDKTLYILFNYNSLCEEYLC